MFHPFFLPAASPDAISLQQALHESVFSPGISASPPHRVALCWDKHCQLLPEVLGLTAKRVATWSAEEVRRAHTLTLRQHMKSRHAAHSLNHHEGNLLFRQTATVHEYSENSSGSLCACWLDKDISTADKHLLIQTVCVGPCVCGLLLQVVCLFLLGCQFRQRPPRMQRTCCYI